MLFVENIIGTKNPSGYETTTTPLKIINYRWSSPLDGGEKKKEIKI